jgi:hypothetical protein
LARQGYGSAMRAMFVIYLLVIFAGLAYFTTIGLLAR